VPNDDEWPGFDVPAPAERSAAIIRRNTTTSVHPREPNDGRGWCGACQSLGTKIRPHFPVLSKPLVSGAMTRLGYELDCANVTDLPAAVAIDPLVTELISVRACLSVGSIDRRAVGEERNV
jgi:hypothetical protein